MHEHITNEKIEENITYWTKEEKDAKFLNNKTKERHCIRNRNAWEQIKFEKGITK